MFVLTYVHAVRAGEYDLHILYPSFLTVEMWRMCEGSSNCVIERGRPLTFHGCLIWILRLPTDVVDRQAAPPGDGRLARDGTCLLGRKPRGRLALAVWCVVAAVWFDTSAGFAPRG